jgi:hypothetical protein
MNDNKGRFEAKMWGTTAALLFAASVGHALRLVQLGWTLSGPGRPLVGRDWVAISAIVLYGAFAAIVWGEKRWGLWVAVVGPLMGVSSVLILPAAQIDLFQVVLGIVQFVGIATAAWLLWSTRRSP